MRPKGPAAAAFVAKMRAGMMPAPTACLSMLIESGVDPAEARVFAKRYAKGFERWVGGTTAEDRLIGVLRSFRLQSEGST